MGFSDGIPPGPPSSEPCETMSPAELSRHTPKKVGRNRNLRESEPTQKMTETCRLRIYMKLSSLIAGLISHKANGLLRFIAALNVRGSKFLRGVVVKGGRLT